MLIKNEMLFPEDVNLFYEVYHAMGDNGYKQVKNGACIEECVYTKDLHDYKVVKAYTEGNTILLEIEGTNDFDNEYLKNEVVEAVYTIDKNNVEIKSEGTTFIRCKRHFSIDVAGAISDYKKLVKLCKENKISLSYKNHYKKYLTDNEALYINYIDNAHDLFSMLVDVAGKVEARKIHIGCNDDKYLNAMHDIQSDYEKLFYRSTVISKYEEIANAIKHYIDEIENEHRHYSKLYL